MKINTVEKHPPPNFQAPSPANTPLIGPFKFVPSSWCSTCLQSPNAVARRVPSHRAGERARNLSGLPEKLDRRLSGARPVGRRLAHRSARCVIHPTRPHPDSGVQRKSSWRLLPRRSWTRHSEMAGVHASAPSRFRTTSGNNRVVVRSDITVRVQSKAAEPLTWRRCRVPPARGQESR